jgi:hypothetical protein
LSAKAVVRRTILEFEFLSRIIASMQSMKRCRRSRRRLLRQRKYGMF